MGFRRQKSKKKLRQAQPSSSGGDSLPITRPGAVAVNNNANPNVDNRDAVDDAIGDNETPHIPNASVVTEPPTTARHPQQTEVYIGQEVPPAPSERPQGTRRLFVFAVILILVVAVAVLATLLLVTRKNNDNGDGSNSKGVVDPTETTNEPTVSPSPAPTQPLTLQPSIAEPTTTPPTFDTATPTLTTTTTSPTLTTEAPSPIPSATSADQGTEEHCPNVTSNFALLQDPSVTWKPLGSDIFGEMVGGWFGVSATLSCDGTILASGTAFANEAGFRTGQARVFRFDTDWVPLGQKLNGESAGEDFGRSVDLSDDGGIVAIGALSAEESVPARPGKVRVFKYGNSTGWTRVGDDIIGARPGDRFGTDVAISSDGRTLAVAALLDDQAGVEAGRAYVFEYNETSDGWSRRGSALAGTAGDWFGYRIDLSSDGNVVAIGNAQGGGYVRVYVWDGSDWTRRGTDIAASGRGFIAVALSSSGNIVAVGDRFHNEGVSNVKTGRAAVHLWSGSGWVKRGSDIVGGDAAEHLFGRSVALSSDGNVLAVGATGFDNVAGVAGKVGVFLFDGNDWRQVGPYLEGEAGGDRFGGSVGLSADGTRLVVGSQNHDGSSGDDSGKVQVFQAISQ